MARFFNTADRDFVEDFVFDPNVELAAKIAQTKDQQIGAGLAEMDLLGNIKFKYNKDADTEYAKEVKDRWGNRVNEESKAIQQNLLDIPGMQQRIAGLRRELEKDQEFGDISKLERNYQMIEDWSKGVDGMDESGDREKYKTILQNYMNNAGGYGAKNELFRGPELHASKGYLLQDFLDSSEFKALHADKVESISEGVDGGWIVKSGGGSVTLTPERIQAAYKNFAKSNPNVMGRARVGEEHFGESWTDANGELSFAKGSVLGDQLAAAANYRIKDRNSIREIRESYEYQQQLAKAYAQTEEDQRPRGDVDVTEFWEKNEYANKLERKIFYDTMESVIQARLAHLPADKHASTRAWFHKNIKNLNELRNHAAKMKLTHMTAAIDEKLYQVEGLRKASYEPLKAIGYQESEVQALFKELNQNVENNYASMTFQLSSSEGQKPNEKSNSEFIKQFANGLKPQTMINKEMTMPNGEKGRVKTMAPVTNSTIPIITNSMKGTGISLRKNNAMTTLHVEYYPIINGVTSKESVSVEFRGFFDMEQGPSLGID